jgi:hypothetical protein
VNIYDPMDRIVYRHLDTQPAPIAAPAPTTDTAVRLPSGYANGSPRTYLGRAARPLQAA